MQYPSVSTATQPQPPATMAANKLDKLPNLLAAPSTPDKQRNTHTGEIVPYTLQASEMATADRILTYLAELNNALHDTYSIADVMEIRDRVDAIRFLTAKLDLDMAVKNRATESQIRTVRRLSELVDQQQKNKGVAYNGNPGNGTRSHDATACTYADMGLDKRELSRIRPLARIPAEKLDEFIHNVVADNDHELTMGGAIAYAKNVSRQMDRVAQTVPHATCASVLHGDMLSIVPSLGKFDLIIADPPYNVTEWEWDKVGDTFLNNVRQWLTVCKGALAEQYHMFWFCSPRYVADTEMIFRSLELPIHSRIIWHRRNMAKGSDAKYKFIDTWEMILHSGNARLNFGDDWDASRFDVQTYAVPQTNFCDTKVHPTQKPLELISTLVRYGSFPGWRVLDPFAGGGTTGEACIGLRDCTLVEQEQEYIDVIKRRLGL